MAAFTYRNSDILVTSSHDLPDKTIDEYCGIVMADVTSGRHVGKDVLAGLRNFFGGRSGSWENTLHEAQQQALDELVAEAKKRGADAVIALEIEDEALANGGMMNIKAVGTAVKLDK